MKILGQLLPGVRELRTPLVVGILWIAAAALLSRHLPPSAQRNIQLVGREVRILVQDVPTSLRLTLGVLAVYLFGVVAHELAAVLTSPLFDIGGIILLLSVIYLPLWFALVLSGIVGILIMLIALLIVGIVLLIRKIYSSVGILSPRSKTEVALLDPVTLLREAARAASPFLARLRNALDPNRNQIDYFMQARIDRAFLGSAQFLEEAVQQLRPYQLQDAAKMLGIKFDVLKEELGRSFDANDWGHLPPADMGEDLIAVTRQEVIDGLRSAQSPLRQEFAETFGDRQKLREDVKRRVERANVRLRAEQPALYDEYDRLRSEGEFRVAVAPPMAAVVIGTCLLVARLPTHIKPTINTLRSLKWVSSSGDQWKATSSTVWRLLGGLLLTTAAGLIVFSLMFAAGRGRTRSATDLLYASVRQEVIENRDEPDLRPTDFG